MSGSKEKAIRKTEPENLGNDREKFFRGNYYLVNYADRSTKIRITIKKYKIIYDW